MNVEAVRELRALFVRLPDSQCDQGFFMEINGSLRPVEQRGPGCGADELFTAEPIRQENESDRQWVIRQLDSLLATGQLTEDATDEDYRGDRYDDDDDEDEDDEDE